MSLHLSWLRAARRHARAPINPWLVGLATAAAVALLLGWGAESHTALRMWFGIAAGLGGMWMLAGAVCWQIRRTISQHTPATPPAHHRARMAAET